MDIKQKSVYRLSEWEELKRRLQEPASAQVIARRRALLENARDFREGMPPIPGDVKDWIRTERGENLDG